MRREQRRLNLEAQLRELETQRAVVERQIAGLGTAAAPELTHHLTTLQAQIADAERDLDAITGGDQQTQAYRRAVDNLTQWTGNLQQRIQNIEQSVDRLDSRITNWIAHENGERHDRQVVLDGALEQIRRLVEENATERRRQLHQVYWLVISLVVGELILGVALVFFASQVWRITELWR